MSFSIHCRIRPYSSSVYARRGSMDNDFGCPDCIHLPHWVLYTLYTHIPFPLCDFGWARNGSTPIAPKMIKVTAVTAVTSKELEPLVSMATESAHFLSGQGLQSWDWGQLPEPLVAVTCPGNRMEPVMREFNCNPFRMHHRSAGF